ncbi:expressed unknown protein [Seminavis robusta]|uniref:Uncharacterized protein n=1 Tax=Seminavis robusta TaxID=568900 RepID=A0A9N8H2S8_9STRA|nr:expressed unknown protein [Seminavis robusta]|eukprot:Sro72_g039860.1 n/a (228) ;mRNA; f:63503-64186
MTSWTRANVNILLLLACFVGSSFAFVVSPPLTYSRVSEPTSLSLPHSTTTINSSSNTRLYFFFGGGNDDSQSKDKELAFYPKLATSANADVKFESLATFISTWAQKFEDDRKGMGLTTPVKIKSTLEEEAEDDGTVVEQAGVRIVFQPTKTGYKSKKEENKKEDGEKKKKGPPKEGGVQLRVIKLDSGEVQLKARRCDIDEDTTIKEMSEEAIVHELKEAVDAWKKQ